MITIIVLLILAGVSIAMLAGENGILKKAQDAIGKSESAQIEENATLADYENILAGGHIEGSRDGTIASLQTKINELESKINLMSSAITLRYNATSDCQLSTDFKKVSLGGVAAKSGGALEAYDGGVKIGAGVSCIELSATSYVGGTTNGDVLNLAVRNQNGTELVAYNMVTAYNDSTSVGYAKAYISPTIVTNIKEGDVLYLNACNNTASRGKVSYQNPYQTRLTVKVIK